jgi:hypothetical protein
VLLAAILGFAILQLLLALFAPMRFVSVSLLLQTMPFTWTAGGLDTFVETPIGRLNVVALQALFLCLTSVAVLISRFERAVAYSGRYKLHVVFLLFCAFSVVHAPSVSYAMRMLAKLAGPLLFMLATLVALDDVEAIENARRMFLYSGLLLVALALLAMAMGIRSDPNAVNTGLAGLGPPGMGPPVFAAHMLPVTMLALALYLAERRPWYLVVAVIGAASVLGALERTCAAALFIGVSLILFLGTRGVTRLLLPVTSLLSFPPLLIFNDTFRRRMFFDAADPQQLLRDPLAALGNINGSGRFDLWNDILTRFFVGHEALGSGVGATQDFLYSQSQAGAGVAHSEYVRLLCEVGIVGLTLYLLAMAGYAIGLTRQLRGYRLSPYPLAALAALLCYMIYMSTDNAFDYVNQFGCYAFALVALAIRDQDLSLPLCGTPTRHQSAAPANLMR